MGRVKSWIDWSVLALCMVAALGAVVFGAGALDAWPQVDVVHGRPDLGTLAAIAGLALVNLGFLIGAAVCQARLHARFGRAKLR
jgi:hypothetical protein